MSSDHGGRLRRTPCDVEMIRFVVRCDIYHFSKERIYVINVDDVKSNLCPYCKEDGLRNDVTHMFSSELLVAPLTFHVTFGKVVGLKIFFFFFGFCLVCRKA